MRRQLETRVTLDKEREFRAAAHSARLRYVTDADRGFARRRRGKSFRYVRPGGEALRDPAALARIQSLAIPPAWQDVWICPVANGHLQATGRDARGRKQYRYHPRWREAQDQNKYERIIAFAKTLPKIRRTAARHLRKRGLPREKVLAAAVKLLEATLIRVGNDEYARDNESYGLTTMHKVRIVMRGVGHQSCGARPFCAINALMSRTYAKRRSEYCESVAASATLLKGSPRSRCALRRRRNSMYCECVLMLWT